MNDLVVCRALLEKRYRGFVLLLVEEKGIPPQLKEGDKFNIKFRTNDELDDIIDGIYTKKENMVEQNA